MKAKTTVYVKGKMVLTTKHYNALCEVNDAVNNLLDGDGLSVENVKALEKAKRKLTEMADGTTFTCELTAALAKIAEIEGDKTA